MIKYMYPCLILTVLMWSLIAILDYTIPIEIREAYREWCNQEAFRIGSFVIENGDLLTVIMFLIFVGGGTIYFYYYVPRFGKEVEKG